jgi:hypothetical protein
MQIRIYLPIMGAATAFGLMLLANVLFYLMLGEVNGRSPESDRISPWWVSSRVSEVYRRHRDLYPDSKTRLWTKLAIGAAIALWVGSAVAFYLLNAKP